MIDSMAIRLRTASELDIKSYGLDASEADEWPIKKLSMTGANLLFEEGQFGINVLLVETQIQFRRQGRATRLIDALKKYAGEKTINWGTYTEMGEKFLRKIVEREPDQK